MMDASSVCIDAVKAWAFRLFFPEAMKKGMLANMAAMPVKPKAALIPSF